MSKSGPVLLSAEVVDAFHEGLGMCLTLIASVKNQLCTDHRREFDQLATKLEDINVALEALCQRES